MNREWKRETDNGAVHVLGGGRMMVYAVGPELIQILGTPYSAESFGSLTLPGVDTCRSERQAGAAIWRHYLDNGSILTDVADSEEAGFLRYIQASTPFTLVLTVGKAFVCTERGDIATFRTPEGTWFFVYKTTLNVCRSFGVSGEAEAVWTAADTCEIRVRPGESTLCFANDPETARRLLATPQETVLARTAAWWQEYLAQRRPVPPEVAELYENVAILIKCQQGEDGGVLAGYPFHLAYIRDQYGVVRGLLKMGFYAEAKAVLQYYLAVWQEYGTLHTAQTIGIQQGIFHIHENDKVEITGYLAVLPFDVYAATGDAALLDASLPLVRWALDQQLDQLERGMLPFNGDETYIAGGFLPRSTMYDGSAEATMLLAEGIRRYQTHTGDTRYAPVLTEIEQSYLANFCPDGRFVTNVPERMTGEQYPATRHGVCENCRRGMLDLTKTATFRYVCADCRDSDLPEREPVRYELAASRLAPLYIGSPLIPPEMARGFLDEMVEQYRHSGQMPSGCGGDASVGYDYGMLLYALTVYDHPAAGEFCRLTLSVVDEAGAWCEYYNSGVAAATRCRPWESAINMEAVLTYLERHPETP